MTAPTSRLRRARETLDWTINTVCRQVRCSSRLWRHWEADDPGYTVPEDVLAWLEDLAAYHRAHPAPAAVKRKYRPVIPLPGMS